jgi:two-component system, NarL family, sensor histidine kinase DevS
MAQTRVREGKHARKLADQDAEARALRCLARLSEAGYPSKPIDALQQVVELARELTDARYAALAVTDGNYNVEGFVVSGLRPEEERKLKAAPLGHGPLGSMRKDGLTVRIDNLEAHAAAFGFPPRHPEMKTLLGLPIWVERDLRGALYVTDRSGGEPFLDDDEAALHILARHAAAVIATRWY